MKKTEVKLIADHLEKAFTETEQELELNDLARTLITELDAKREKDDSHWTAIVYLPLGEGGIWKGLGPFSTKHQAEKAVSGLAAPGPAPGRAQIIQLHRDIPT